MGLSFMNSMEENVNEISHIVEEMADTITAQAQEIKRLKKTLVMSRIVPDGFVTNKLDPSQQVRKQTLWEWLMERRHQIGLNEGWGGRLGEINVIIGKLREGTITEIGEEHATR